MDSVFLNLNSINVNDHTEKKNGLTYLSWAWAWAEVKKRYPDATYAIYENADGWFYHTDGRTAWVKTGVTINGLEHVEYLPVMDYKNRSIPLDAITSFDVNKAIQRSLTKAVARHGLGLYIYAGEDLPDGEDKSERPVTNAYPAPAVYDAKAAVKKFCEDNHITGEMFTSMRNACIEAGLIPRKAYGNMTEAECKEMIDCVRSNMGDSK